MSKIGNTITNPKIRTYFLMIKQYFFFLLGLLSIFLPNLKKKYWRGKYFFKFKNLKWSGLDKKELINLLRYYGISNIKKLKINRSLSGTYKICYKKNI